MERRESAVTPARFAQGMTFDRYVAYTGTPENLQREAGWWLGLQQSPFFAIWASATVDEIISALHERLTLGGLGRPFRGPPMSN